VSGWLAAAHPSPDTARHEWDTAKLAMIPLGRRFDAVRLPKLIVHVAAASDNPAVVEERLADYLCGGPVIHDPGCHRYYALVPPGTAATWQAPVVECLGDGTYLGVPRVDLTTLEERTPLASYWAVPMTEPDLLCKPAHVLSLAMVGGCLTGDDES
jgi:hypothetical protein